MSTNNCKKMASNKEKNTDTSLNLLNVAPLNPLSIWLVYKDNDN